MWNSMIQTSQTVESPYSSLKNNSQLPQRKEGTKNDEDQAKSDKSFKEEIKETVFFKPSVKRVKYSKRNSKTANFEDKNQCDGTVNSLLYTTAAYIVKNECRLKQFYSRKFNAAWDMINSEKYSGNILEQCYETVRDLNKKQKLLRCIENDDITEESMADIMYFDEEVFLREKHMFEVVNRNPAKNVAESFHIL
ncbi:uncharacterized protein LOC132699060 [Cylas formicarius]|uniref:uncharacterized protein LOC132699060 n=1 Tax=Cylas formicarius TaxID=197179 RepID=UPI002958BE74|nr:uncharacterized protein LOC132699060 [Cylas formicarius]